MTAPFRESDLDLDGALSVMSPKPDRRMPTRERPKPRTLGEYLTDPALLAAPVAEFPFGLAQRGCVTLLSGREKSGKSTIMSEAVAVKTTGGEWLGVQLEPATVFWYALDEPVGDLVRRMESYGTDSSRLIIQETRPETAEQFADELADSGAAVVVLDSLSRLWRGKVKSANDGEDVLDFCWPYIEAVRAANVAACFLYHTSRAGKEYRGSVELGAAVDVPLTFRRRGHDAMGADSFDKDYESVDTHDDGRRLLSGTGRGVSVNVRLAFANGRYSLGDTPRPLRERIAAELAHDPASATALADMLSTRKQTVLETLHSMRADGTAQTQGTGSRQVWALASSIGSRP